MISEGMSKDVRALIALVIAVAIPLVGFQWKQSVEISAAMVQLGEVKGAIDRLTGNLGTLIQTDVSDLKSRLLVLEHGGMKPETSAAIKELEIRLRNIETARAINQRGLKPQSGEAP